MMSPAQGFHGSAESLAHEVSPLMERRIHQLIVAGFRLWANEGFVRFDNREESLTVRMLDLMDAVRREWGLGFRVCREQLVDTDAILAGTGNPAKARRIDLMVFVESSFDGDTFLGVECKRLDLSADLCREYVKEGMMRFVDGHYAVKTRVAAMIGYVIDGSPGDTMVKVNGYVESILGSGHALVPADSVGGLETVYASCHTRFSPFPRLRLTHFFFDMTGVVDAGLS